MIRPAAAVMIHGLADARAALAPRLPATLVSAPGAALYAGAGWWTALMAAVRAEHPDQLFEDILDCGDAPGRAAEALRAGQRCLALRAVPPASYERVRLMAEALGALLRADMPEALDLARPGARRRLPAWLAPGAAPRIAPGDGQVDNPAAFR